MREIILIVALIVALWNYTNYLYDMTIVPSFNLQWDEGKPYLGFIELSVLTTLPLVIFGLKYILNIYQNY